MINPDPSSEDESSSRTSLISMGLAILAVLMVPVFLYSVGPEGPMKVGDVVFSTDRHRVPVLDSRMNGEDTSASTCFLESRVQLVVQKINSSPQGSMMAHPIGGEKSNPHSCSPNRLVLIYAHQVTLKPDVWGSLRDTVSHFFSGG
jgi:hypothetical protein